MKQEMIRFKKNFPASKRIFKREAMTILQCHFVKLNYRIRN